MREAVAAVCGTEEEDSPPSTTTTTLFNIFRRLLWYRCL